MAKLATRKEMIQDGWKIRVFNGQTCFVHPAHGLVALAKGDYFWPEAMLDVVEQLGKPDKIHTLSGQVQTLEYFNLAETA